MQLTKDDGWIPRGYHNRKVLDFSKFQQVVEFYEKYKDKEYLLKNDYPKLYKKWWKVYIKSNKSAYCPPASTVIQRNYYDWLFNFCFKDGLK
jgi:hypothetical protein